MLYSFRFGSNALTIDIERFGDVVAGKELTMEEYHIQPVSTEERTYDGVYVDSLGAWLGNVVNAHNTSAHKVAIVEPAMNTIGGRIPAPAHWRDLVIKRLVASSPATWSKKES